MNWHWKDLLPVDRYTIRTVEKLNDFDQKVLTLLYQPLIGALAHSLYLTFWSHLEKDVFWSSDYTHRHLMTMMDTPLNMIYEARKKLEGIGLIKTYKKKNEDGSYYVYELQPPMSPHTFFSNDVLSVYLYNRLGKNIYRQVRERFTVDKVNTEEFYNVTRSFDEVFTSLHHSEIVMNHQSEQAEGLGLDPNKEILSSQIGGGLVFSEGIFDFDLFESSLSSYITPGEILNTEVKEVIARLAYVYRIEPLEMSRLVEQTALHEDHVNLAELRKRVQEWYKIEHGNEPPRLGLRKQPIEYQLMHQKEPKTDEEKLIKLFETVSPIELLEIRSDGGKVPPPDVKIIEELLLDYNLLPGVANVLLDYVMRRNDMKLSKPLIDKIAGHWARKNIKTVIEAMALAKEEHKTSLQLKDKRNGVSTNKQGKTKLPKWVGEEKMIESHLIDDKDKVKIEKMLEELKAKREQKE